jgi:hypothetical protein
LKKNEEKAKELKLEEGGVGKRKCRNEGCGTLENVRKTR